MGRYRRIGGVPRVGNLNRRVGYFYATLSADGREWKTTVHSLVMLAFVGPRPNPKAVVNHIDGNKQNNRLENLEYTTHRRNMREAVRLGLQPIGERHPNAKLRNVDVAAIRACVVAGKTDQAIAEFFGVSSEHVGRIARNERRC